MGNVLEGSGWEDVLVEAGVTTSGGVKAILHASHLKRCRLTHEISIVVFTQLKKLAYIQAGPDLSFEEWNVKRCTESPTFFFWDLILRLQILVLMFVRSIRQRNFQLYRATLEKIAPLSFSLDCTSSFK